MAREVRHQEVIEASFDRAEAYARLGDFDRAVEWLDRAATVSGGLPPSYRAQRARWVRSRQSDPGKRAAIARRASLRRRGAQMTDGHQSSRSAAATEPAEPLVFEFTAAPMAGPGARRALLAGNGALPSSVVTMSSCS